MIDDVLVNVANAITNDGFDPANLPSKSTSYQVGPTKFKASLSGGKISGLGKLARIGLTRYITPPNTKAKILNKIFRTSVFQKRICKGMFEIKFILSKLK